jgi:class 3 adenylate cyclase
MALRIPTQADGRLDGLTRRLPGVRGAGSYGSPRVGRRRWSMKDNHALMRLTATGVFLLTSALTIGSLLVWLWRGSPVLPAGFVQGTLGVAGVTLVGLVYGTAGLLIVRRSPRNLMGWLFLAVAIGMSIVLPIGQYVEATVHPWREVPQGTLLILWGLGSLQLPVSGAAVVAVLLLFPSGRPEWHHWKVPAAFAITGAVLLSAATAFRPEGLLWYSTLPNPMAAPRALAPAIPAFAALGLVALITGLVLAALRLAWRYRTGDPRQRPQLLWVMLGSGAMAVTVSALFVARYLGIASDELGERLVLAAGIGAVLLPLSLMRFAKVSASRGEEVRDMTFLFTDLTDSTAMYERIGDAPAVDAVRVHLETLEAATRRHGGTIVKTIGDAVMAAFTDPAAAVGTALEMFDRLAHLQQAAWTHYDLKVGLHRGPAIAVSSRGRTDYFGQTVNLASRMVEALARGGEIVMTEETYHGDGVEALLQDRDIRLENATVKGVAGTVAVHRVQVAPDKPDVMRLPTPAAG